MIKTDVRGLAAIHQDLEQQAGYGRFREDLFHRLNVVRLRLPGLSERKEEILVPPRHFLAQSASQLDVEAKKLSDGAPAFLAQCDLKGNVRQLEKAALQDLAKRPDGLMDMFSRRFETVMIQSALRYTEGRKNEAAGLPDIGRNAVTRKVKEPGIADVDNG